MIFIALRWLRNLALTLLNFGVFVVIFTDPTLAALLTIAMSDLYLTRSKL